ncbi:hypothetical protein [uncultured Draconibacterium sp.]|uniref:hypothetical protein n=1 Tax=uncultured Draconibacterium sp. TaxID=1573823 RepID=UPI0025E22462|nr:hypothetical protein [uncultured Draconibacterium sp.]
MKQNDSPFKIISSRVFVAVVVLLALAACGPSNTSNVQTETSSAELASNLLQEINNTVNTENQTVEASIEPEPQELKTTETEVKINPPHGEPGHRCDIAVGAPLDAPASTPKVEPAKTTQAAPVVSTASTTTQQSTGRVGPTIENLKKLNSPQPINYAPGASVTVNPPHGQPGHRCDIPVGDPLPVAANNSVKLNPPHGQPGHRCDIAVGSPLPS